MDGFWTDFRFSLRLSIKPLLHMRFTGGNTGAEENLPLIEGAG